MAVTPIAGITTPDGSTNLGSGGDPNVVNIGSATAAMANDLEKIGLPRFSTAAARNAKITSANAVVGMYSVILSPSVHTEKLASINNDGTLTWVPSDIQIVSSKAQQSAVTPTPGALLYRSDVNVLSLADAAGGTFWALGHAGSPLKYEQSGKGSASIDGGDVSYSPNYYRISKYDFVVTPTRDGYATLDTVMFGGTSPSRVDGGSPAGWVSAKVTHSRDGQLLSPFGSFADVIINEGSSETYKPWHCPQPVYLREGQATTFSVAVQVGAKAGSFGPVDFRWVLYQP